MRYIFHFKDLVEDKLAESARGSNNDVRGGFRVLDFLQMVFQGDSTEVAAESELRCFEVTA